MLQLNKLEKVIGKRKRVGRGRSCGRFCGRGEGGQKSRTGSSGELKASFEGGQMPLVRRLPRRGFTNFAKKSFKIVNLKDLEIKFADGEVVSKDTLQEKGLIKGRGKFFVKILGNGSLTKKLTIQVSAISASASEAIQKAGGLVELQ